jgi:hypothetical protein
MNQCECGRPVPQRPQELGWPVQDAASDESSPPLEANSDNFLSTVWTRILDRTFLPNDWSGRGLRNPSRISRNETHKSAWPPNTA